MKIPAHQVADSSCQWLPVSAGSGMVIEPSCYASEK
jgi:hypothetical protein